MITNMILVLVMKMMVMNDEDGGDEQDRIDVNRKKIQRMLSRLIRWDAQVFLHLDCWTIVPLHQRRKKWRG